MKRTKIERFFDGLAIAFGRAMCYQIGYRITIVSTDQQWGKKILSRTRKFYPRCSVKLCKIFDQVSHDEDIVLFDGRGISFSNQQEDLAYRVFQFIRYKKASETNPVFLFVFPYELHAEPRKTFDTIRRKSNIDLNLIDDPSIVVSIDNIFYDAHKAH